MATDTTKGHRTPEEAYAAAEIAVRAASFAAEARLYHAAAEKIEEHGRTFDVYHIRQSQAAAVMNAACMFLLALAEKCEAAELRLIDPTVDA